MFSTLAGIVLYQPGWPSRALLWDSFLVGCGAWQPSQTRSGVSASPLERVAIVSGSHIWGPFTPVRLLARHEHGGITVVASCHGSCVIRYALASKHISAS